LLLHLLAACCGTADELPDTAASERDFELQEAREARQAAERRALELNAALEQAQAALERLQGRYAALYLASLEQQRDLEYYELRIAGLLTDGQAIETGTALRQTLADIDELLANQHRLRQELEAFGRYLQSVLDILEPSEVLRRQITERFAALTETMAATAGEPPSVAGRGGEAQARQEARVLSVNDELQIVVLDRGLDHGVKPGSRWLALNDGKLAGRLQVIEARSTVSAAVMTEGRLRDLGPGAEVRRED